MSVRLMGEVWRRDCDPAAQLVLLALADHADDDGAQCYPSVGRLAWKIGRTPRHVRRLLATLRTQGVIEVVDQGGGAKATKYRLRLDLLPEKVAYVPRHKTPDAHVTGDIRVTPDISDTAPLTPTSATPDAHVTLTIREPSGEANVSTHMREGFARFWLAYPKKVGKGAAEKVWVRLKPSAALTDTMLAAIPRYLASDGYRAGYRHDPATWLNQRRWEDDYDSVAPTDPRYAIDLDAVKRSLPSYREGH